MTQPILHTARLELVPLAEEHLELEVQLDSDAEVLRYIEGLARTRTEAVAGHRRRLADAETVPGLGVWIGFAAGDFVGWWSLRRDAADQPAVGAELGYRLGRRRWRQGLGSEGSRELLRFGFADLDLPLIFARTMAVNAGSRVVMARIGMTQVRTFHGHFADPLPGNELGEVEYAIDRAGWAASVSPR